MCMVGGRKWHRVYMRRPPRPQAAPLTKMPYCTPDPISAAQPVHAVATAGDDIRCNDFVWSVGSKAKTDTAEVFGDWANVTGEKKFVGVAVSSALKGQRTTIAVAGVITAHADIPEDDSRKIGTRLKVTAKGSTQYSDRDTSWRPPKFAKATANDPSYVTFLHTDSRDTSNPGSFRVLLTGGSTEDSISTVAAAVEKARASSAAATPAVVVEIDAAVLAGWITALTAGDGTDAPAAALKIEQAKANGKIKSLTTEQQASYDAYIKSLASFPLTGNIGAAAPPYPPSAVGGVLGHILAAKGKGAGTALLRAEAFKSARKFDRVGKAAAGAHIKRFKETGALGAELAGLFVGYTAAEAEAASNFIATGI